MSPIPTRDDVDDPVARSVRCLQERVASIPEALRLAADASLPAIHGSPRSIVTTGIGASEGPARLLACTLAEAGIAARFVPLSTFAIDAPAADLLVLFSQNLSPNARLALTPQHRFGARWLVTSAGFVPGASKREAFASAYAEHGVTLIRVPPATEDGMLLRIVGTTVASLMALRIAAHLSDGKVLIAQPSEAADAYVAPLNVHSLSGQTVALVGVGPSVESLHGHRCKLLESLLIPEPFVWDVLQIAHGPLQSIHEKPMTLLAMVTPDAIPLLRRLEATLSPHHQLIPWVARRNDRLAFFEHAAAVDACLLATLRESPRNLFDWPGRHADAPLYNLGNE
jgi:hypothetical protein